MSVTERLFLPYLLADSARPLITHYDESGNRVELSRATVGNWAAKTANFLVEEFDVDAGDPVAVALPAHWQTLGILLGAWWCGACVTEDPSGARGAFVAPGTAVEGAEAVAVVALDPMGMGLSEAPEGGALDYLTEVRMFGDDFVPLDPVSADTPALGDLTVAEVVAAATDRASVLGISERDRVLSTQDWSVPGGVTRNLLPVLASGAALIQCADTSDAASRKESERVTAELPATG